MYKEDKKIIGILSFAHKKGNKIRIEFIYSNKLRKGIGKKLIKKLANYALKNRIGFIYTSVSSNDERAINFYRNCGFKFNGKYHSYRNMILYRIKAMPKLIRDIIK